MKLTKDIPLTAQLAPELAPGLSADMSVAPEIARLAEAVLLLPEESGQLAAGPASAGHALTIGTLARRLRSVAASPERWWGLVRFEPDRSVQITVEEGTAYRAWLVILPPGHAGQS